MNIKSIVIENVKGIEHLEISQEIFPNRPNILVAPNGFGKSSIAVAFKSLTGCRMEVKKEDKPNEDDNLFSQLTIDLTTGQKIKANTETNTISNLFDIYVINSQLIPKAKAQRFGKIVTAKASMDIEPTIIYKTIPRNISFAYNLSALKRTFGQSGKILIDISGLYAHLPFVKKVDRKIDFHTFELKSFEKSISRIIEEINSLYKLRADNIKKKIQDTHLLDSFCQEFTTLASMIKEELMLSDDIDALLSAWQYISVKKNMKSEFNKAVEYAEFKEKRMNLDRTLENLNPVKSRFNITSKIKGRSLVIEWPKANLISGGQRDIMVFIAKLIECEFQSKGNCILVIDEFFDYLDDANVVAFQYYISSLIDSFKKGKRLIFPILLTHLDPNYLKHFCFNDKKMNICYLKKVNCKISKELRKMVTCRDNDSIKDELNKYYFHYSPKGDNIDISEKLKNLNLNPSWGTPRAFRKKIDRECRTYLLEPTKFYDPLAVCFSTRQRIEELVYNLLKTEEEKNCFLSTHGTNNKLNYANSHGVSFPETFFLLGIVYNHPLHLSEEVNLEKPLGMKFDNIAIKSMIMHLWENQ